MDSNQLSKHELTLRLQVDAVCLDFEERLRSGSEPRIETVLRDQEETHRPRFLEQMLEVEFEFKQVRDRLELAEYLERFPDTARWSGGFTRTSNTDPKRRSSNVQTPRWTLEPTSTGIASKSCSAGAASHECILPATSNSIVLSP